METYINKVVGTVGEAAKAEGVCSTNSSIDIEYQTPLRLVFANPKEEADIGRVAVMHGPFVMCAEVIANDGRRYRNSENPELKLINSNDVIGKASDGKEFKLIPYYKWCNRAESDSDAKMAVWLLQSNMPDIDEYKAHRYILQISFLVSTGRSILL